MMKNAADPLHKILSAYDPRQENLLPILHAVQDALGYIPPDSVQVIAHALSISHAEVHGVVTFYHHFRTHPTARHHLQVCRAEACRSMGAENLYEHAVRLCGNQANPTGSVTVQATYCLGLCATSPAVLLDDTPYGRVTPDALDTILDQVRGEK